MCPRCNQVPSPARASQGPSLFRSLYRGGPSATFLRASQRDPWGTGQVPHSARFPTALLPALGLPSPVGGWLQGRWPDPQISTLSLFTPLISIGFQVSKGFIGHPAVGDESALPVGRNFRAGRTRRLHFPREASAMGLPAQAPAPYPLASHGLLGSRGSRLPTLGVVFSRTLFPPSS